MMKLLLGIWSLPGVDVDSSVRIYCCASKQLVWLWGGQCFVGKMVVSCNFFRFRALLYTSMSILLRLWLKISLFCPQEMAFFMYIDGWLSSYLLKGLLRYGFYFRDGCANVVIVGWKVSKLFEGCRVLNDLIVVCKGGEIFDHICNFVVLIVLYTLEFLGKVLW